jgi:hypothetical protein
VWRTDENGRNEKSSQKFQSTNLKQGEHTADLSIDGNILSKQFLTRECVRAWRELVCLKTATVAGSSERCKHGEIPDQLSYY